MIIAAQRSRCCNQEITDEGWRRPPVNGRRGGINPPWLDAWSFRWLYHLRRGPVRRSTSLFVMIFFSMQSLFSAIVSFWAQLNMYNTWMWLVCCNASGRVCLSLCLSSYSKLCKLWSIETSFFVRRYIFRISRSSSHIKVIRSRSRSQKQKRITKYRHSTKRQSWILLRIIRYFSSSCMNGDSV